jgi:hypothetical protein
MTESKKVSKKITSQKPESKQPEAPDKESPYARLLRRLREDNARQQEK